MSEPLVKCPRCGAEFPLNDAAMAPIRESEKKRFDLLLEQERARIAAESSAHARQDKEEALAEKGRELEAARHQLQEKEQKLAEAQKEQAEALKLKMALEEEKREYELRIQKGIKEGIEAAREKARKDAEEALSLSIRDKDLLIRSLTDKIDEMKKKAEQGSQQAQGEAQELALEEVLKTEFPTDSIEPVEKGIRGADCIQRVRNETGQIAGSILWESKRTKNWSNDWLPKLREDQRTSGAEVAILTSQTLPAACETLTFADGVWVCSFPLSIPLARVLRPLIIEISRSRQVTSGQKTKTEMIYAYLTGPQFKARVETIVEAFTSMRADLDKEKKALIAHWAKREKELEKVLAATTGMYGDLQGIAGSSIQELQGFTLAQLDDRKQDLEQQGREET